MSQVHRSTIARPTRVERDQRYIGAALLATTFAAALMMGVFIFESPSAPPAAPLPAGHLDLVDGWLPAAAAAQAARLERVQDGYLPGLVNARQGGDLVDGYLPGLLAARSTGDPVDGWLPAFAGRGQGADVRDGWESSLLH